MCDLKEFLSSLLLLLNSGFNVKQKTVVPYIHEAKSSDIWGVSVSYQSHQLFPGQLKSKQFVKKTEGSGHDATGPNSSHLQNNKDILQSPLSHGTSLNKPIKENRAMGINKSHNDWCTWVHFNPSYFKMAGATEEDGN